MHLSGPRTLLTWRGVAGAPEHGAQKPCAQLSESKGYRLPLPRRRARKGKIGRPLATSTGEECKEREMEGEGWDVHVGGDVSGADAVDLDVVRAPLVAEGLRELPKGALGGRIRRHSETALEAHPIATENGDVCGGHNDDHGGQTVSRRCGGERQLVGTCLEGEQRAEVDDLAAAERHHVLPRGLREEPDGLEVHVQHLRVSTQRIVSCRSERVRGAAAVRWRPCGGVRRRG